VTNVTFFLATTNTLGQSTNLPYFVGQTNLPTGTYTFTARATDNLGATGDSAPVTVTVIPSLPLTVSGPIKLNYQTGFYQQTALVTNPTAFDLAAVGVVIYNLPTAWRVQNASFTTNGAPGVLYNQTLAAGGSMDVTINYYLGAGASTNASPTLVAIAMEPSGQASAEGNPVAVTRSMFLNDGTFLLNFNTVAGGVYFIQYSADMVTWMTSPQPLYGNGYSAQWIDYGPPATDSPPNSHNARFYRVVQLP